MMENNTTITGRMIFVEPVWLCEVEVAPVETAAVECDSAVAEAKTEGKLVAPRSKVSYEVERGEVAATLPEGVVSSKEFVVETLWDEEDRGASDKGAENPDEDNEDEDDDGVCLSVISVLDAVEGAAASDDGVYCR